MARRRVVIVPHTHWDREWYLPYQSFRLKLVDTLDAFLPHLEIDPSYAHFLLDGQMAVVDDYLEVRPEQAPMLRRLAASGRLAMGPWYTLPDEFLVSGETLVRNLQTGLQRAEQFGGAMDVGYLPDMFGHIAQMPQILRLAGFEHAVVWRGVPRAIDRTAFWWTAPDGSTVRAEYLPEGYGNGEGIADDAKALVQRIAGFEGEHGAFLPDGWPILWMNGTDHQAPQAWLGRVVREANELQDAYELEIASLEHHVTNAPVDGLPRWTGELRSGARANLLMGVASNRVDVKQAAARAERALENRAEPLCALFLDREQWPATLLDLAWREVLRNAAHDSVCACSVDEVCDAVLVRYAEARQIGEGLATHAVDALAETIGEAGWVAVNPTARTRGGVVEFDVPGVGPLPGAQVLTERNAVLADQVLDLDGARPLLTGIRSQQLGGRTFINRIDIEDTDDGIDVTLHTGRRLLTNILVADAMRDVLATLERRPDATVHLRILRDPYRRILVHTSDVPGFGWAVVGDVQAPAQPVRATDTGIGLTNGSVTVVVDESDGTFAVNGVAGMGRLADGGDAGDTYNYSPPDDDQIVDASSTVNVRMVESGPIRGVVELETSHAWSAGTSVFTTITVCAGEPFVRVSHAFENRARDHRLRAHFPLPSPAAESRAECAFTVVHRGLEAEGGPTERGLATFPSRRFVQAGEVTVVHEGLLEYELVDGRELALTLLRSTGMLSRVDVAYRPLPAGPPLHTEGSQCIGRIKVSYAVAVAADTNPYAMADAVLVPLEVRATKGNGARPSRGTELTVHGAEVSAVRVVAAGLEVRVFNPTDEASTLRIDGRDGWVVDLRGRPIEPFSGERSLGPHSIATLWLRTPPAA